MAVMNESHVESNPARISSLELSTHIKDFCCHYVCLLTVRGGSSYKWDQKMAETACYAVVMHEYVMS